MRLRRLDCDIGSGVTIDTGSGIMDPWAHGQATSFGWRGKGEVSRSESWLERQGPRRRPSPHTNPGSGPRRLTRWLASFALPELTFGSGSRHPTTTMSGSLVTRRALRLESLNRGADATAS